MFIWIYSDCKSLFDAHRGKRKDNDLSLQQAILSTWDLKNPFTPSLQKKSFAGYVTTSLKRTYTRTYKPNEQHN